jgi:TRAP-type C4-dicarboxylate transport system substrate-binding protein
MHRSARIAGGLAATVIVIATSSCAEEGSASGGGQSVEAGADLETYRAAFADVQPIELHAQTSAPKGSVTSQKFEDYYAAVTEWSDGKITFDVSYSNAVAGPEEVDDALADGRLDVASATPLYEPQEYPANGALNDLSFLGDQDPVNGILEAHAWSLQAANDTDAIYEEFEDNGVKLLLPYYNGGSVGLFCGSEFSGLDDMRGAQSATSSVTQSEQVESLGATPVSIAYTEVFESLERSVVDCTTSSLQVSALGGFIPAAPHVMIDPEVGFGLSPGTIAYSLATWESLPLPAQQLLYDRLDVFLQSSIKGVWENSRIALGQIEEEGGAVRALPDDARAAMEVRNAELVENVRQDDSIADGDGFVDAVEAAVEDWRTTVVDELPYGDDVGYDDFVEWYDAQGDIDLAPYTDLVFERILSERRPG